MFVVLLKFSANRGQASRFVAGHKEWIQRGLADGVFLLVGSLQPDRGGAILVHDMSLANLQSRVSDDPFVANDVVSAEILHIDPSRADPRLDFLLD